MTTNAKRALVGVVLIIAFLMMISLAASHSWYDFQCCSEFDCRQTVLKEVERHDGGWFVVPSSELIPFDDGRIRRSLDPLIHICTKPDGSTRCLYVPEMGG